MWKRLLQEPTPLQTLSSTQNISSQMAEADFKNARHTTQETRASNLHIPRDSGQTPLREEPTAMLNTAHVQRDELQMLWVPNHSRNLLAGEGDSHAWHVGLGGEEKARLSRR